MECRTKFQAWEMEIRVDEADAKTKRAMEMFAEVQARKQKELQTSRNSKKQRMDSQNQLQKEIMELAAQHGALTRKLCKKCLDNKQRRRQSMVRKKILSDYHSFFDGIYRLNE